MNKSVTDLVIGGDKGNTWVYMSIGTLCNHLGRDSCWYNL